MVKLGQSDERLFGELRSSLERFLGALSPLTERFAPLDVILRKLLASKLGSSSVAVQVAVMGRMHSGKSTLVNAMLGQDVLPEQTRDVLKVHPAGKESGPVLRTVKGKCVAVGPEKIKSHLRDERIATNRLPELMTRELHAPILSSDDFYAAVWEVLDTTRDTSAVCPKLSSVASRIFSPNEFYADVILYCVDARLLGTSAEGLIFDNLITLDEEERKRPADSQDDPPGARDDEVDPDDDDRDDFKPAAKGGAGVTPIATRKRLLECTFFVLTHMDVISNHEESFTDIHSRRPPALTTVQQCYDRFCELAEDAFDEPVPEDRVLVMNVKGAQMVKNVLKQHSTIGISVDARMAPTPAVLPTVHECYEYAERFFGSAFMQKIDATPLDELQRLVVHHSWSQGLVRTGAQALDSTLSILDFNVVRHLMTSVAVASSEAADTLAGALKHGVRTLESEHETAAAQVKLLESELAWALDSIDVIQSSVAKALDLIIETAERAVERFFKRRLEELQYVIEHKGLEWFMSRQTGVAVDMKASLQKFEAFTVRYLQQRRYLHDKMRHIGGASGANGSGLGADGANSAYGGDSLLGDEGNDNENAAARPFAASSFLAQHMDEVLDALEKDRLSHLMPLFTNFSHHLRDEVVHALGDMQAEIDEARCNGVDVFVKACAQPVAETRRRVGADLDLEAIAAPLRDVALVEANPRRLHNFLRELPEHVASAAVGMANDEYQRARAAEEERLQLEDDDDDADDASDIGDVDDDAMASRVRVDKSLKKLRVGAEGLPEPGTPEMERHLGYISEAWRIALVTVGIDQLGTFRFDELSEEMANSSARVVEFLGGYAQSIREGLEEHRALVEQIEKDAAEAQTKASAVPAFLKEFNRIRRALAEVNATDNADVTHVQLIESRQKVQRRRSMDSTTLPRRRASLIKGLADTAVLSSQASW